MSEGMATVPEEDVEAAIESAEECPGEYIFLEAE
jgi:ferredoxin